MCRFYYLPLFLLVLPLTTLHSQPTKSDLLVTHYTTDNGLPQNSVKDIRFDKAGYCWLTTEMGLVRFDGKTFRTYGTTEIQGLRSDRMDALAADKDGYVFIKTTGNQVLKIETSSFNTSPFPRLTESSKICIGIDGYAVQNQKIVTEIDSLVRFNSKDKSVLYCGRLSGDVYIYNKEHLYYAAPTQSRLVSLTSYQWMPGNHIGPLDHDYFVQLSPHNKATVWKSGSLQPELTEITGVIREDPEFLAGKFKLLWCENGAYIYAGSNLYQISIKQSKLVSSLALEKIVVPKLNSLYFSPEQNRYYLGSLTHGLYVAQLVSFQYPKIPSEVDGENFYAQARLDDKHVFLKDAIISPVSKAKYAPFGTVNSVAFYLSPQKHLYYEDNFTLRKYDFKNGRTVNIGQLDSRMRSIFLNPTDSLLFFCTERYIGRLRNDTISFLQPFPSGLNVVSMMPIGKNQLLLATESGLKWYDMKTNRLYRSVLGSFLIRTILPQKDGRIWIASYGKGFFLYENGRAHPMPLGPDQALKTVHAFIDDGLGYFWLPTNNGLFKVRKEDLVAYAHGRISTVYFYRFSRENGLRTNEFNGGCDPSYVWLKDSLLSLPSLDGLVWFYPNKIKLVYPNKKIYIDWIRINNKVVAGNQKIILPPNFDNVSIAVSSPYFGNQENRRLEYNFKGAGNQWHPLPESNEININGLPAGQHELVVRKGEGRSTNDQDQLMIVIDVNPWFYTTWWFYLLVLAGICLLVYLISSIRVSNLKNRSRMLEEQIASRTLELNKTIEVLGQSELALLKSNQAKDKVITMVLHDLRSPIRFMVTISNYLANNHDRLSKQALGDLLAELKSGSLGLNEFSESFFKWAVTQQERFTVSKSRFALQDLFTDIGNLYQEIVKANNNQLQIEITDLSCYTDYQSLAMVLRNLIDNANKNTHNGFITLNASSDQFNLFISVSDTGKGLTQTQINHFLDEDRNLGNEETGSLLILQMLNMTNGKLAIESKVGIGSAFHICLPILQQYDTAVRVDLAPQGF